MPPLDVVRLRHVLGVLLGVLLGCSDAVVHAQPGPDPDWAQPHATGPGGHARELPPPTRFDRPAVAQYHMRRHFADLRMIEQFLLAGDLLEATTLAYLLIQPLDDPGMAPWRAQAQRVTDAAAELTRARSLDEALRREVRVAGACVDCHIAAQGRPMFGRAPALPPVPVPEDDTRAARMARHAWAVDRLWEGLIGLRSDLWTRGLSVLAESPAPFPPLSEGPALAVRLARQARAQLDRRPPTTSLAERVTAYGEILVTCAACHEVLRR